MGRTSAEVKNRYRDKTYDRAELILPRGRKADIQTHAKEHKESMNSFINRAIDETMARDRGGGIPRCSSGGGHAPDHDEQIKGVSK